MYQDIVFPDNNEPEFIVMGKRLGYKKIVFCYRDSHKNKSSTPINGNGSFKRNPTPPVRDLGIACSLRSLGRISENTNIPAELGAGLNHQLKTDGIFVFNIIHAIQAKNPPYTKNKFTIYKADAGLRHAIEKGTIDVIYGQEELEKRDKMHFRLSGLNHVLCKIAKDKGITIGFSFNSILNVHPIKRALIIGRMQQNVRLCRKYKLPIFLGSFADRPFGMRLPNDLISFGIVIGMHSTEAKKAVCGS